MNAELFDSLGDVLQQWAEDVADSKQMPPGTWTSETVPLMTKAAAAVFDANFGAQELAAQQKKGKA